MVPKPKNLFMPESLQYFTVPFLYRFVFIKFLQIILCTIDKAVCVLVFFQDSKTLNSIYNVRQPNRINF